MIEAAAAIQCTASGHNCGRQLAQIPTVRTCWTPCMGQHGYTLSPHCGTALQPQTLHPSIALKRLTGCSGDLYIVLGSCKGACDHVPTC